METMSYGWRGWKRAASFDTLKEVLAWRRLDRQVASSGFHRRKQYAMFKLQKYVADDVWMSSAETRLHVQLRKI